MPGDHTEISEDERTAAPSGDGLGDWLGTPVPGEEEIRTGRITGRRLPPIDLEPVLAEERRMRRTFVRRRLVALGALALLLVGMIAGVVALVAGGGKDQPVPEGGSAFRDTEGSRDASVAAASTGKPAKVTVGAKDLALPLERAAAQVLLVGFRGQTATPTVLSRLGSRDWGAVVLGPGNVRDASQVAGLTAQIRQAAANAGHLTPLVAVAQAGGDDSALPDLPPMAEPDIHTAAGARSQASLAAQALRPLGVTLALAPSADLSYAGGPWEGRTFGDDPRTVDDKVAGAVAGWTSGGVAAAPGHFPGEGAASQDPLDGVATVGLGLDELREADLRPFARVARSAPAIAMSDALYAAWDGVTPATLLPDAVKLLRSLGFHGVVVSGNLAAATLATGGSVAQAAVDALKAGCDLLYIPGDAADEQAAWRGIVAAVRAGDLPVSRLRDALNRVLALKRRFPATG